jgi:membrane protease YdiL (CAAX protease family)
MKENRKLILSALAIPLIWILSLKLVFLLPLSFAIDFKWFIGGIIGTLLALLITVQFSKLNKVSMSQIGMNWESKTPFRLLVGIFIGTAIACIMLFSNVQSTDLEIKRYADSNIPMAFFWMLAIIPLAFMEEVAFRGFVFFKLKKIIGLRFTIIVTSILFAYYHDLSGASFITQLLGPGIWGVIYGVAAIWSKGLAVPTGIHIGANVVLASLGMKDSYYAIWMVGYSSEISESTQSHTEMIGIIVQLILLLFGIIMTELYLRKRKKSN